MSKVNCSLDQMSLLPAMNDQLSFNLPIRRAVGRGDFFVSHANEAALQRLDAWQTWPDQRCLLVGPAGAGKSHLLHIWANAITAKVFGAEQLATPLKGPITIDDVDGLVGDPDQEEALFNRLNEALVNAYPVLLTARSPQRDWGVDLPDLKSRLQAIVPSYIDAPDDDLLRAIMAKQFGDRQLLVPPKVLDFIIARIDRDYRVAQEMVAKLDAASLARGQKITIALSKELLAQS